MSGVHVDEWVPFGVVRHPLLRPPVLPSGLAVYVEDTLEADLGVLVRPSSALRVRPARGVPAPPPALNEELEEVLQSVEGLFQDTLPLCR